MDFYKTKLEGAYIIEINKIEDKRGFLARLFCKNEFMKRNMDIEIVQCNITYNKEKGTLRGLHYQIAPYEETKLVQCIAGTVYDVIVDLRPYSPSFKQWIAVELTAENCRMLYVPKGFAHGFQTLTEDSVMLYHVSEYYSPECSSGVRWNDDQFGIEWPNPEPTVISDKDRNWPNCT